MEFHICFFLWVINLNLHLFLLYWPRLSRTNPSVPTRESLFKKPEVPVCHHLSEYVISFQIQFGFLLL